MSAMTYELRGAYGEHNKVLSYHQSLLAAGRAWQTLSRYEQDAGEHAAYVRDPKGDDVTMDALREVGRQWTP